MKKTVLREYARLIVRCGANVQKGQEVLVYAGLDQPEFVQMVVEEAYKAKAKEVTVHWNYQPLTKVHYRYMNLKTLGEVKEWEKAQQQHCKQIHAAPHTKVPKIFHLYPPYLNSSSDNTDLHI